MLADALIRLLSPAPSLRSEARRARGRVPRAAEKLIRLRGALGACGREKAFGALCAASAGLFAAGCAAAAALDNPFLAPACGLAFAALPYALARGTLAAYDRQMKEELETALSAVTASYIRSGDICAAAEENLECLKPPVREVFRSFCVETAAVSSDVKGAIRRMSARIDSQVFREWCAVLEACQDDRTLRDTLLPSAARLADMRIVNGELETMLAEARKEYAAMALLTVGSVPLLYLLNRSWYQALMGTLAGKIVLAVCAAVLVTTAALMMKYTRPLEYRR